MPYHVVIAGGGFGGMARRVRLRIDWAVGYLDEAGQPGELPSHPAGER